MSTFSPYSSPPEQGTRVFKTHVWILVQQCSFLLPVYPFLHKHIHLSHCIMDKLNQNPSRPVCNATSQNSSFHPFPGSAMTAPATS